MGEREECEQALGRNWAHRLLRRRDVSDDYGFLSRLPGRFGRSSFYAIETQDKNYNCGLPIVDLVARFQSVRLPAREVVEQSIDLTYEGTNPVNLYRGLLGLGIVCTYFEGMKPVELANRLVAPDMAYIIDAQALDTNGSELMDASGGHLLVALCSDPHGIYMADPGWDYSTRYSLPDLGLLWYDREIGSGRWFVGSAIGVPITYQRIWR